MHIKCSAAVALLAASCVTCNPVDPLAQAPLRDFDTSTMQLRTWDVLGPFQIGTREAAWGADPLEKLGGFHALDVDDSARFPSSLAPNGTVGWRQTTSRVADEQDALQVRFPDIDWSGLQAVYGWPALQWQAWARSSFVVDGEAQVTHLISATSILEFWVDDTHFWGGDYYSLQRAPLVLRLSPGRHQIELRLVRDTRAMGASNDPAIDTMLHIRRLEADDQVLPSNILLPDVVHGQFVSQYGSVTLSNALDKQVRVDSIESFSDKVELKLHSRSGSVLEPGQSRPVAFTLNGRVNTSSQDFDFKLNLATKDDQIVQVRALHYFRTKDMSEPQRITYVHPGGVVSYAMLRPPSQKAIQDLPGSATLPILLYLHGSGVEADNPETLHMLESTRDLAAWTLFASGVTSWCGDDWHHWGWRDVEAAMAAIPTWTARFAWSGPVADPDRWLVTGHSNGGQGLWYALSHHPDKVIAAVPQSGYLSIQAYVPYSMWTEADPAVTSLIHGALNSYRHELLVPDNARGIPIAMQHGGADGNVPVYHARRMYQLASANNSQVEYLEVPGVDHVYEGMFETPLVSQFLRKHLDNPNSSHAQIPSEFKIVSANPADTSAKFGLKIEELALPGRLGKLRVTVVGGTMRIDASNVRQFSVSGRLKDETILIDGKQETHYSKSPAGIINFKKHASTWIVDEPEQATSLGGLDVFLRTNDAFTILQCDDRASDTALEISRNLLQYFGADSSVVKLEASANLTQGNAFVVGTGSNIRDAHDSLSNVEVGDFGVRVKTIHGEVHLYSPNEEDLGAVFLRAGQGQGLEMVVWGANLQGLRIAARLVPLMSGTGQPDFIVTSRRMLGEGAGGALAMGFFDGQWRVQEAASYFS